MTTENTDMTSAIDQDQAQLDSVQEETPQADPVTEELQQIRKLVENQNSQIAGLQSKQDRALNRIRMDEREKQRQQQDMQMQQFLQTLPEEQRQAVASMYSANRAYDQENEQLREQIGTNQEVGQDPQPSQENSQWEQVYAMARGLGVDPNHPNIDYDAFTELNLTDDQRRDRFLKSIGNILTATNQATNNPIQESTSQIQSPPAGGTPASGASSNMRSLDQVQSAYIEGKLSKQEYQDQLNRFGQ